MGSEVVAGAPFRFGVDWGIGAKVWGVLGVVGGDVAVVVCWMCLWHVEFWLGCYCKVEGVERFRFKGERLFAEKC